MRFVSFFKINNLTLKVLSVIALSVAISPLFVNHTSALSGSDFNPGNIIDNGIFYNGNAMSADQIQNFLNNKVPSCDTNGSKIYSGSTTRAQYGASRGYPAPYICLKDFNENGKSAAQIIYSAAQTYNVNPQVILVTLQKESSIVTDDWPWPSQYKTAMGYGCPDTGSNNSANCDSQWYGFTNQVTNAAKQFRRYATSPNSFNFIPGATANIQYNPNTGCGSSAVYIQNQATASLYNYTPYQPNSAALNNLYGTGDSCSAYGNRNFWRIFNEWFGSTHATSASQEEGNAQKRIKPIVFNNQMYTFYYDAFTQTLRMATKNTSNGQWQYSILDGNSSTATSGFDASMGGEVSAVVYNNTLQLFYYDKTRGNLRHGWLDTGTWRFENLDGDGGSVSHWSADVGINPSVTVYKNSLQLIYYDKSNTNLRHAWADTNGWHFENLDGDGGSISGRSGDVGVYSTLTTYGNDLQTFYYDQAAKKLRHGWSDANGWHFENLDGDGGSVARWSADVGISSTAVEYSGMLQVFYYDKTNGNLRHGWLDTGTWHFENLDGDGGSVAHNNGDTGFNAGVMTFGSTMQIYYYDRTHGTLRHSYWDVNGWNFEDLGPNVIY